MSSIHHSRRFFLRTLLLALTAIPFIALAAEPITVFAAASLKESMDEIATAYERHSGVPVRTSYAASSTLARQIENGAPADVFFSADLEWMDYLQERDRIDTAHRRQLLGNRLVLIAPANQPAAVDLSQAGAVSARLGNGRLAVGRVESVPAGRYGKAALISIGAWDQVRAKLAESDSVRAAMMLVSRREAPLGIVYASDAKADPAVVTVATFAESTHPPIIYPVAPVKGAHQAQAAVLVQWLSSPEARTIFERRGFSVLVAE
ncbi:MAG: molybdate ABC transporter substrate-binding protein [Xanthomonadaceae bacterium]|jgi:molybdate transport system substrate-binding protein|nr:molybdate ABC transporter substrate-binding protein [Xanthomonadaceae bacterium]